MFPGLGDGLPGHLTDCPGTLLVEHFVRRDRRHEIVYRWRAVARAGPGPLAAVPAESWPRWADGDFAVHCQLHSCRRRTPPRPPFRRARTGPADTPRCW